MFRRTLACLALAAALPGAAVADTVLGKVETVYLASAQNLLVEYTPGMRTHDREFVAQVRLRDAAGQPARRVLLRMGSDRVDEGDVVALHEGDRAGMPRVAPLPARDRFAHVEAARDTVMAQTFFKSQPPAFLALRRAD